MAFPAEETILNVSKDAVNALEAQLQGRLIHLTDPDYDQARAVWNGMIDNYPALIVQAETNADVIAAVNFARVHNVLVSVRGGGHNVAGSAVVEGGLVIDLRRMKAVDVNPSRQTVRVQGGATLADLDAATQAHGLAVPVGAVSETGVAGLTLGGGYGWLRRKYGLSADNVLSMDVVTADGRLITVSENHYEHLFWALRGGGGGFGIVTAFEFQAYPLGPDVYLAFVFHPGENAAATLRKFRAFTENAPDEVGTIGFFGTVPSNHEFPAAHHGKPFLAFAAVYVGDPDEGERVLRPLREFDAPVVDFSGVMPFTEVQQLLDEDYPAGELRYYWKSTHINSLSDAVIDSMVALAQEMPSPLSTLDFWHNGGAIRRVDAHSSAIGNRDMPFMLGIESNWEDPADDDANIAWARRVAQAMKPFSNGGEYANFPGSLE